MLRQRIASSAVFVPPLILLVILGEPWLAIGIALVLAFTAEAAVRRRPDALRFGVALAACVVLSFADPETFGAAGAAAHVLAPPRVIAEELPPDILASLAPKSTTTPVAMGIAERIGGIPALSAVFAVLTGMIGALSGKYLFDLLGVRDLSVRGFALAGGTELVLACDLVVAAVDVQAEALPLASIARTRNR